MAWLTVHMYAPGPCADCELHGIDPWRCWEHHHDDVEAPGYYIERTQAGRPYETDLPALIWKLGLNGQLEARPPDPARPF